MDVLYRKRWNAMTMARGAWFSLNIDKNTLALYKFKISFLNDKNEFSFKK